MPPATCQRLDRLGVLACILAAFLSLAKTVQAATVSDLDPAKSYETAAITISGDRAFSDADLLDVMKTKARPFYLNWQFWKAPPAFVPSTFEKDIANLERFYQARGYYGAKVNYDLDVKGRDVSAHIHIDKGKPVKIAALTIDVKGSAPRPHALDPSLKLPLARGDIFEQGKYQIAQQHILAIYMSHGYARARVRRRAEVFAGPQRAYVWYVVNPGPRGVFGRTTVHGTRTVDPELVTRGLTYKRGEIYDSRKLAESRAGIVALNLFSSVEFEPQRDTANPGVVPILIKVNEKPKHSLNLMLGYNTESQFNVGAGWNDYNFLGGGRQFRLSAIYSNVISSLDAKLLQPYFFSRKSTLVLHAAQDQEVYQTYTLNASRFDPLWSYTFTPEFSSSLGWRIEYLKFNSLNPATIAAIGGVRRQGILSGPAIHLLYKSIDDLMDPHHGAIITLDANVSDGVFGADYRYWRAGAQIKHYNPLPFGFIFAKRFELGFENTFATIRDIPLSERFYSGGEGSVRGYGLRRIGPLSAANQPLGGRTLVEGSLELRHSLFWKLDGAAFFDCGQVSVHAYDVPVDALQCGYGPAVGFATPVGPLRLDLGFPTKTPHGDSNWQIYFSIGQYF
jgi:outer membrane protein assembly complex protein YaeT